MTIKLTTRIRKSAINSLSKGRLTRTRYLVIRLDLSKPLYPEPRTQAVRRRNGLATSRVQTVYGCDVLEITAPPVQAMNIGYCMWYLIVATWLFVLRKRIVVASKTRCRLILDSFLLVIKCRHTTCSRRALAHWCRRICPIDSTTLTQMKFYNYHVKRSESDWYCQLQGSGSQQFELG